MQDCCRAQAGQGEYCQPGPSGRLKPKPRHHPRRRYRSGEDRYAPEVEAPAPVPESPSIEWQNSTTSSLAIGVSCLPLQPVHGYECHDGVDLATPAPVNDPRLATIRWQLVRRRSREQDLLPKFRNGWTGLRASTEQIRQNQISQHGTSLHEIAGCACSPGSRWSM